MTIEHGDAWQVKRILCKHSKRFNFKAHLMAFGLWPPQHIGFASQGGWWLVLWGGCLGHLFGLCRGQKVFFKGSSQKWFYIHHKTKLVWWIVIYMILQNLWKYRHFFCTPIYRMWHTNMIIKKNPFTIIITCLFNLFVSVPDPSIKTVQPHTLCVIGKGRSTGVSLSGYTLSYSAVHYITCSALQNLQKLWCIGGTKLPYY